jgi:arabinogalactan endo-1,4-beta-galactosidase
LKAQGTLPEMVQIGNEITPGMLWEDGRLTDAASWGRFAELINSGIQGVNDSLSDSEDVKIMIHIDKGGDNGASIGFYDKLIAQGVDFDVIGLSYYLFWHGTPSDLYNNLRDLSTRYGKDIVVVETAFPFTLNDADGLQNIIYDEEQIRQFGYPATVAGQKQYLEDIIDIIRHTPGGKVRGLFYWEPAWLGLEGAGWDPEDSESKNGWENQGLFNFDGYALKSLDVFLGKTFPPPPPQETPGPGDGAIPEPSTALLMALGLAGIVGALLRKK